MGLDVTWYRRLRPVPECVDIRDGVGWCDEHVSFFDNPDFPGRAEGVETEMCYDVGTDDCGEVFCSSYSAYSRWRTALSRMALGVDSERVWEEWPNYAGKPFAELINFSDCEGTIGPVVATRLAADFAAFDERARETMSDNHYRIYRSFADGCAAASDGGALRFH